MLGQPHGSNSTTRKQQQQQRAQNSDGSKMVLPRLNTVSRGADSSSASSAGRAGTASVSTTSRQRSRPASPILTSAIPLDDMQMVDERDMLYNERDRPPRDLRIIKHGASHSTADDPGHGGSNGGAPSGTSTTLQASTSRPVSRSASRNSTNNNYNTVHSRTHSPVASTSNVGLAGVGISRATTPLLYASQSSSCSTTNLSRETTGDLNLSQNMFTSHSSSSFLLGSSSGSGSYAQVPNAGHSMVDLHDITNTSTRTNKPRVSNSTRRMLSPRYLGHRMSEGVNQVRAALSIGIPGEWRDLETGQRKIPQHLRAYIPLLIWVGVSIAFAVIVGVWHQEVFSGLDALSKYLKSQGYLGDFILYLCIFITTFPPLPLYSTLIFLSGYSFGLLEGFIISYTAALSGAVVVYLCSKVYLKDGMENLLNKSSGLKKVLRAIERRPRLLWLIRLSPYPYNVMNVLLASSSTLSFSCYFWCTALALPKLIIHCSVGTTIRSFAESAKTREEQGDTDGYAGDDEELERELSGQRMKAIAGLVGILLCVGVFIYLLIVARRAVDELDDTDCLPCNDSTSRSRSSTLEGHSGHQGSPEGRTSMAEYRPLSAGLVGHTIVRPQFQDYRQGRRSLAGHEEERTMMVQRHVFERQDSSMPYLLSDLKKSSAGRGESTDLQSYDEHSGLWSRSENGHEKGGKESEVRVEYVAGDEQEGNENIGLLNSNEVVDRLESIASKRSSR